MEIRIENAEHIDQLAEWIEEGLSNCLQITNVKVIMEWVETERWDDTCAEELRRILSFELPAIDSYTIRVLTTAFEGTMLDFYVPETGFRFTIG